MIYIYITNEDIADLKPDHVDVLLFFTSPNIFSCGYSWTGHGDLAKTVRDKVHCHIGSGMQHEDLR